MKYIGNSHSLPFRI
jgi:hypothetical protein